MTTIRLHSYTSDPGKANDGSVSCDFRGDKFIGDAEGDHHKTLLEKDVDENDALVAETLTTGPTVNAFLSKLEGAIAGQEPEGTLIPRLRVGVWDKKAPH